MTHRYLGLDDISIPKFHSNIHQNIPLPVHMMRDWIVIKGV